MLINDITEVKPGLFYFLYFNFIATFIVCGKKRMKLYKFFALMVDRKVRAGKSYFGTTKNKTRKIDSFILSYRNVKNTKLGIPEKFNYLIFTLQTNFPPALYEKCTLLKIHSNVMHLNDAH